MTERAGISDLAQAMLLSLGINIVIVVLAVVGAGSNSPWLLKISDWLSAPPVPLIRLLTGPPRGHSVGVFLIGGVVSLALSFLFYAVAAFVLLKGIQGIRDLRSS